MPSTPSPDAARRRGWLLVAFLSGAGVMMLELAAPRLMQPWFGSSAFVWTNVIAVILLALAVGYELGGRLAARDGRAVRVARFLLISGVVAAALPWVLPALASWLLPDPEFLSADADARTRLQLASFVATALLIAPPIFLLAAVSPQIVHELSTGGDGAGRASGRVYMAGTVGSLIGTLLPAYVVIPLLGVRACFLIAAVLLITPGAWLLVRGGGGRSGVAAAVGAAALLFLPAAGSPLRPALDGEKLNSEIESSYQYLRVTTVGDERFLRIDEGVTEYHSMVVENSTTTRGRYYDYFSLLGGLVAPETGGFSVLVLGSGAGTMARSLCTTWPDRVRRIVNVEIDPEVIALETEFDYDRAKTSADDISIAMDGRIYTRLTRERFDLVFIDAYARQADIPSHMATLEFFEGLERLVEPGGIIALNASAADVGNPLVQALGRTMKEAGWTDLWTTPVAGYPSTMIWARRASGPAIGSSAPASLEAPAAHARRFTREFLPESSAMLLTDDHAPVAELARMSSLTVGKNR